MNVCSHLNFLAILVGTILYFALGAIWYSKALFAKQWGELHNLDFSKKIESSQMITLMAGSFVVMLLSVWAMAVLNHYLNIHSLMGGIKLGLLCGGLFAGASIAISNLYLGKKLMLYFIDCGYHIVGYTIAAVVLTMWH